MDCRFLVRKESKLTAREKSKSAVVYFVKHLETALEDITAVG